MSDTREDQPITIEQAAIISRPGESAPYSNNGYIITADGTVYALVYQWFHGAIIAILYPDLAKEQGIGAPIGDPEEVNVFAYQRFEHDVCHQLEVIRIAIGRMTGLTHVSKGDKPATDAQIQAVAACMKALGYKGRDRINTEYGDLTLAELNGRLKEEFSDAEVHGALVNPEKEGDIDKSDEDDRSGM